MEERERGRNEDIESGMGEYTKWMASAVHIIMDMADHERVDSYGIGSFAHCVHFRNVGTVLVVFT